VKVDPFSQLLLLDLQALDTRASQLRHRQRGLPEIAELVDLEQRAATVRDKQVAIDTDLSDLEREQRRAEADVEVVRRRITRDQELLDTGKVSSARQLEDLQRELESLRRRQGILEDAELEIMERVEDLRARSAAVTAARATLVQDVANAAASRDKALSGIHADLDAVTASREELAGRIAAGLLAEYERIRGEVGDFAAAALHRGRCQGCQMELTPADLARIRAAASDELLNCEECGRILVRTAESGI
jgi:uncharacterized protein